MQKTINIPAQINVTDVQPFIKVSLNNSMNDYTAEQRKAIDEYLSHITELGFSYNDKDIIVVKKQGNNLFVNISDTF